MKFAPSSTAIRRAIFLISFSENPTVRSAFRSWQMPKKSMFGFITFSFNHGATLFAQSRPCFEILMLAPVRRFFPEQRQRLNGSWRCSRVLHPSEDLSELPPLRSVVAGQVYHCPRMRSLRGSLPKAAFGWMGTARHLIGPSLCWSIAPAQVVFAHPPHRCSISGSSA